MCFICVFCIFFLPLTAFAQDDDWQFEVTPFFWGLTFDGTSVIGGLPALDVNMGNDEMYDNFNGGAAVFGIVKKDQWSLFTEATYLSLGKTKNGAGTEFSQNLDTYLFMAAGGYRLPIPVTVDLYGRARFMRMDVSNERNGMETLAGDKDWIDPIIGLHMSFSLAKNFAFNLNTDMGGFGVGSDVTYMVMPVLSYQFSSVISGKLAYRWLDVDYDKDDFSMDMLISGPMLGVTFKG